VTAAAVLSLRADLAARFAANWWMKLCAITGFITVFFFAYLMLLRFPFYHVTVMPLTALDRFIPFQPWTLGLYFSLWFYVSLPPALLRTRRELYVYGWIAAALALIALTIFFFWPTSIPPSPEIVWSTHPAFAMMRRVDESQNACPSLHVAFSVFSGIWLDRVLRQMKVGTLGRALNVCWCVGIVYSTISTRQHVAIDVIAGAALGVLIGLIRPTVFRGQNS
jgi:membrane-associated phospholipid phosphatase